MEMTPDWANPLEQDQRTKAWRKWRHQGIGASDCAAIMGVSPWKTAYQLWEEKIQDEPPEQNSNYILEKGKELEPAARSVYEALHLTKMPPAIKSHKLYDFLKCSLDGWSEEKKIVLEIKMTGKEDHALAKKGKIPEKYIPQTQMQLFITGASAVHYYSWCENDGELVKVYPDLDYQDELLTKCINFWMCVTKRTPPPLTDRDYVEIKEGPLVEKLIEWKIAQRAMKEWEATADLIREEIETELTHPRMRYDGVRMQKLKRTGGIDYSKVEELKGLDLEKYRKKGSEYWTFSLDRETP